MNLQMQMITPLLINNMKNMKNMMNMVSVITMVIMNILRIITRMKMQMITPGLIT